MLWGIASAGAGVYEQISGSAASPSTNLDQPSASLPSRTRRKSDTRTELTLPAQALPNDQTTFTCASTATLPKWHADRAHMLRQDNCWPRSTPRNSINRRYGAVAASIEAGQAAVVKVKADRIKPSRKWKPLRHKSSQRPTRAARRNWNGKRPRTVRRWRAERITIPQSVIMRQ